MADPVVVTCTKDTWVKVATSVTSGQVHKLGLSPNLYFQTYRLTGGAAPTNLADAVTAFVNTDTEDIAASAGIDVYLYAKGAVGSVRVDV